MDASPFHDPKGRSARHAQAQPRGIRCTRPWAEFD